VGSEEHEGAFLLANSWGTDWGVEEPHLGTRGFFWLSYDYVQHDSFQQAWVMTDRIGYVPTVFAVCGVNHSKRGEVGAGFAGGADPLDPSWSLEWLPFLGGSWYLDQMGFWREAEYPVDQNLVADLSDCGVAPGDTIWLQIEDLAANGHQGSNTVGQIIDLEVEFAGPPPRSSVDVPKTTCNGGTVYVRVGGGGALDDLVVYPNPCYPEKNQSVYFLNLPEIERSSIRLYTVSGELVRELEKTAQWDCTTEDGSPVARGVYLYVVDVGGARRTGKIAIIR